MTLFLVLEDDPVGLRLACAAVDKAGFFSLPTTTLAQAREAVEAWPVDGVLVDVVLPDGTGTDFVRELREEFGAPGPPVLICTASAQRSTVADAIEVGANDYTVKPFNLRELTYRLRRLMDPVRPRFDPWEEIRRRTGLTPQQHGEELLALQRATRAIADAMPGQMDARALHEAWTKATHLGHRGLAMVLGELVDSRLQPSQGVSARLRREARAVELFNLERTRGVCRIDWTPGKLAHSEA